MKHGSVLTAGLFLSAFSYAQLQGVSLQNIQACNGATLIASPVFNNVNPVTLYYEKQVPAVNWVTIVIQVCTYQSNYILITPGDISIATTYRVRAVDEVTHQEFISNGVTADPVTASTCIYGIVPFTNYTVRVTDVCGKVSIVTTPRLDFLTAAVIQQNATTCNNGKVVVNPNSDDRYKGIPPYTYALGKIMAGMGTGYPPMNFVAGNVFDNLGPSDYYAQVKDACGHLSNYQSIRLGAGFPRISTAVTSIPADSCYRTIDGNGKLVLQKHPAPAATNLIFPIQHLAKDFYIIELTGATTERLAFIKN